MTSRRALLVLALAATSGCASYEGPSFAGEWVESDLWRASEPASVTSVGTGVRPGPEQAGRGGGVQDADEGHFAGQRLRHGGLGPARLTLSHDPDAIVDAPVRGTLVDGRGREWAVAGDPEVRTAGGGSDGEPVAETEVRSFALGWSGPLSLWSDQGESVVHDEGPVAYSLARGRLRGQDVVTLRWGRVGRFVWSDPPDEPRRTLTFVRAGAPSLVDAARASETRASETRASESPVGTATCDGCGEALEARWQVCPVCGRARS